MYTASRVIGMPDCPLHLALKQPRQFVTPEELQGE